MHILCVKYAHDISPFATSWSNDEQTKKGPTCWKCKGTCVRPVQKKLKVHVNGGGDDDITNNASTTTTIETNQNNNIITNQRPCPVCEGRGHLPIKSKYISSQNNKAGVITSRRRRPVGWKEYGHVPSAVRASLRLLDVAANDSSMCDKEDNAPTQEDDNDATAVQLLYNVCHYWCFWSVLSLHTKASKPSHRKRKKRKK